MIVFGHNSFVLNDCKPSELGMPVEIDLKYRVERRQRYVHLFWIPTFGIGKIWVLRDIKSDELYEPNATILQVLNSLPLKEKTPWYTFALPLLAIVVAIVGSIYMKVSEYTSAKRYEETKRVEQEELKAAVVSPGSHRYFELRDADYKNSFLKVVGDDKNSLKCLVVTGDFSSPGFLMAFVRNKGLLDTIVVDKQKLIESIGKESLSEATHAPVLPDERPRALVQSYIYDDAFFHDVNAAYDNGKFAAVLQNLGVDVALEKVTVVSGNLTLSPLPEKLAFGEEFDLVGTYTGMEPHHQGLWSFKNQEGVITEYDVYINSANIYFNKK